MGCTDSTAPDGVIPPPSTCPKHGRPQLREDQSQTNQDPHLAVAGSTRLHPFAGMFHTLPLAHHRPPNRPATLVILLALLGLLAGCIREDLEGDPHTSYVCACPVLLEAAGQAPPGTSDYWPTDWSVNVDSWAFHLSGSSKDPDPAQRLLELRESLAESGWEIIDGYGTAVPKHEVWRAYFPSCSSDPRLLEIDPDAFEGQLRTRVNIIDDVWNYESWDPDTYIRALADRTPEFKELDALREQKVADLYREFVSGG